MKIKKSNQASMKKNQTLFFLIGLNLVLAVVWLLFGIQTHPKVEVNEKILVDIPQNTGIIVDIIEPPKPEIEIQPEDIPLPEPEIILRDIEEVDQPIEEPIKYTPIDEFIPTHTTTGTAPTTVNVNIRDLQDRARELQDEREIMPVTPLEVYKMAIYPGCEKFKTKKALVKCFGDELSKDISFNLDKKFPDVDKDRVVVKLQFNVNTQGEIVDIVPVGDIEFKLQAKQAIEKVNARMKRNGKRIIPAKMSDDTDAILKFQNKVVLERP